MGPFRLSSACAVVLGLAAEAPAQTWWDHNGSLMRLEAQGTARRFVYESPRAAMRDAGVTPGTLLFDGQRIGDRYSGTMRAFSRACGAMPYRMEGRVVSETLIVFEGNRPVFRDCRPSGAWRWERLEFRYRAAAPGGSAPAPGAGFTEAQITELAITYLLGDPYGRTRTETRGHIVSVARGRDPLCGRGTVWIVSVFVPWAAATGSAISGFLALDPGTGEVVCTNLPLLD